MDEVRDVMTVAEAAEYLKVHIKTLYDWIKSGKLRVIKLGPRSTRILKQDVAAFLESKASTQSAASMQSAAPEEKKTSNDWAVEPQTVKKAEEISRRTLTRKMKNKVVK